MDWVSVEDLLYYSTSFYEHLERQFPIKKIETYKSFQYYDGEKRSLKGTVDLLIETVFKFCFNLMFQFNLQSKEVMLVFFLISLFHT